MVIALDDSFAALCNRSCFLSTGRINTLKMQASRLVHIKIILAPT